MKKAILLAIIALILIAILFVLYKTGPSGDIDAYKEYYADDTAQPGGMQVKATFFGVSTLLFDDGETQFLIDGFFSRPPIYRTFFTDIASDKPLIDQVIETHDMHRVKGIFVAHSHYDHAFDVAYTTQKTGATLYGSVSTLNIARGGGVAEGQLSLYQPFEPIQLGQFTVQVIPSIHSPGNALNDDGVVIEAPLPQPARFKAYSEGGSYDFHITHPGGSIYIKASPNYIEGALDSLAADALFIGMATINKQDTAWQNAFYEETVGALNPKVVVPLHWDDFLRPLSDHLVMLPRFANDTPKDFELFIAKTKTDTIDFRILQGTKSILLFQ